MHDYAMFTDTGNLVVADIIHSWARCDSVEDHHQLYDLVMRDLDKLQTIDAYSEATDTAVREAVYQQCQTLFPVPVFVSRRGKTA